MSPERARADRRTEHDLFAELALGWALHALEPEDEAMLLRHLPDCRRCERDVAAATEVMAAMAYDLPGDAPPPGLRAAVAADVRATDQVPLSDVLLPELLPPPLVELPPEPTARHSAAAPAAAPVRGRHSAAYLSRVRRRHRAARPWWRSRLATPAALAAVAVAVTVGLGAWNVYLAAARVDAQATATAESRALSAVLQPGKARLAALVDAHGQPKATVVVRAPQVQVLAQGLPVDDTLTQTYVLWGMRDGVPTAVGTFDVDRPQMGLSAVGSVQAGATDFPAYAISLEPGRQAPPTPTEIVATGQVGS